MALFDQPDFVGRLLRLMPSRWFPVNPPRLSAVLQAPAFAFSSIYAMLMGVKAQQRVRTASGGFLDLAAQDYFGFGGLPRLSYEQDDAYKARILFNLTAARGTRTAMVLMLESLTGNTPTIFQPNLPSDCGGMASLAQPAAGGGLLAWAAADGTGGAGGMGTLLMPGQVFITVGAPLTGFLVYANQGGMASLTAPAAGLGYGFADLASTNSGGGMLGWVDPDSVPGEVTNSFIYENIAAWMPVGYTAWTLIT